MDKSSIWLYLTTQEIYGIPLPITFLPPSKMPKSEQTPLLHDAEASRPIVPVKWPLYYFPERVRPYLELIRLDKVCGSVCPRMISNTTLLSPLAQSCSSGHSLGA
jgi:hypothetical protein